MRYRTQPFMFDARSFRPFDSEQESEDSDVFAMSEAELVPATLRRGSRGDSVRNLQDRLRAAGFDPGASDGIFGPLTENAVRDYQSAHGLLVDGIVGPQTWGSLLMGSRPVEPIPGSSTDWPRVSVDNRLRHVMTLLVNGYGYPVHGAAGAVGNLYAESELIPSRLERSSLLTPLRAPNFSEVMTDFTPDEVMRRDYARKIGPKYPGVGLAQWTYPPRRKGLFLHRFGGRTLGALVLFDMDAQVDYLVHELKTTYQSVDRVLTQPTVSLNAASDEVLFNFERPKVVVDFPRAHPEVQALIAKRRSHSQRALSAYMAQP